MSYKTLAPRPAYGDPYPDPASPAHSKKKPAPKVACETCRTRKTACDGKRPSCSKCTRKLLPCRYSSTGERLKERVRELQSSLDKHVELVNFLSATPEGNIIQVLRDLRAAPGPMAYLASARNEVDTPQGSRSPTTDTSVAGNNLSCPTPIPLATINPQPRFSVPVLKPGTGQQPLMNVGGSISGNSATFLQGQSGSTDPLDNLTATLAERLRPSHRAAGAPSRRLATPPPYIDERLSRLQIDYWTSVPISNDFAATVISVYLEVDHPFYAFFDADHFLSDLVSLEITFCSPFLVSSLLSHACYTCAAIDSRTTALAHAFFQEAEILYRAERMSDLLPNSSALAIFSMVCTLQCRDDLALETQQLSRQMGERMKLFGVPDEESNRVHFKSMSPHMKIAFTQVAWGLYNWLSLRAVFCEAKPIEYPPILPIPGAHHDSSQRASVSNLEWPAHSLPTWMGCAFPALCTLWVLAQEIAAVYSTNREKPLFERVSLAFAESKYTKLLEWAATLGPELQRREQNTPIDTLLFHMYLHTVILTLFRPFLQSPQRDQKLRDAYLQHTLAKPVAQGLLCMALENRLIDASKVQQVLEQFQRREENQNHSGYQSRTSTIPPTSANQAQVIVNFELAVVDVDAARAHRLASKLEDLLLFDEFTSTTTTSEDEDDCSYNDDGNYKNESDNEQDYESSAQNGSVLGSDLYRTPASDVCTDVNNCWMDGCDWS
ncbi:hypothetical protein PG997_002218 [Apiospora hydei]|uniref:Zn(2)-C6 fungal-type domain-containing protein n=1 Tax=Apiospora hydei TaxID=1337664 RepID=A0ABR1X8S8_9PEZI